MPVPLDWLPWQDGGLGGGLPGRPQQAAGPARRGEAAVERGVPGARPACSRPLHCSRGPAAHTHAGKLPEHCESYPAKLQECRDPRVDTVRMVSGAGAGSGVQSKQCRLGMTR